MMTKKHTDELNYLVQEALLVLPKYEIVSKHLLSRTLGLSLGKAKELFELLVKQKILINRKRGTDGVILASVNQKE